MRIKKNRKILNEAIRYGCRTVSDLAHFLKIGAKYKITPYQN
jgi:hypothetical protein